MRWCPSAIIHIPGVWPHCSCNGRGSDSHFILSDMYACIEAKVAYSRHHDLMSGIGFMILLNLARRLRPHSLLWLGVPCSTWIWVSRGSTKRCRLKVRGSKHAPSVRTANRMIRRLAYVLLGCSKYLQTVHDSYNSFKPDLQARVCSAQRSLLVCGAACFQPSALLSPVRGYIK